MVGFSGYFFDPKLFNKKVDGYSELSPKEKWGLRVILDFVSSSENCSVEDVDSVFMAETGFSRPEWVRIKQKLMVFDERIVSLRSGFWISPWMRRQRKCGAVSDAGDKTVTIPVVRFIENFGKAPEESMEMEKEFFNESLSTMTSSESPSSYADKMNDNIIKAFGIGDLNG